LNKSNKVTAILEIQMICFQFCIEKTIALIIVTQSSQRAQKISLFARVVFIEPTKSLMRERG